MELLNRDCKGAEGPPTTYLITWACYGAWLPGQSGSVPRTQNQFGSPLPEPDSHRQRHSGNRMTQDPYLLDEIRRQVVLSSLRDVCSYRGWTLLAAHVRTNHVHVVVTANRKPEPIMTALKAYSSRALNESALDPPHRRRWARHGSTRYLWTVESVRAAIHYVVREQGPAMGCSKRSPLADAWGSADRPTRFS
ncbi:MAG TPA: transposase [Bryobacteraceae bacterium]|nr:transposase [Bryobacteraceae bacterium]